MREREPVLCALRAQVQLEIVHAAAEVARAAETTAHAHSRVARLEQRAEFFLGELRQAMGRPQLNAALLATMRRGHRAEQSELHRWQGRHSVAQSDEQRAREGLADLRNQERSLERALQAARRKRELRLLSLDMLRADDLWLQLSFRETA
jgi:hypothetical protein